MAPNLANPQRAYLSFSERLPNAPSLKMYCVYGHGKETERSYWYISCLQSYFDSNFFRRYVRGDYEYDESFADTSAPQCFDANSSPDGKECDIYKSPRAPLDMPLSRRNWIDWEWNDENAVPQVNGFSYCSTNLSFCEWPIKIRNGVQFGEGDGTVSLLSLGTMCAEGWKRKRYNPAGIKVTTVEVRTNSSSLIYLDAEHVHQLPHNPTPGIPRGGANTSDHVDILGATQLNDIILKVVLYIACLLYIIQFSAI